MLVVLSPALAVRRARIVGTPMGPEYSSESSTRCAGTDASATAEHPTEAPDADPTCQTIIPAATATDFADTGLTAREDPFYIAGILLPDGIQCTWGDQSVASDQVQVYGWAPITADAFLMERLREIKLL